MFSWDGEDLDVKKKRRVLMMNGVITKSEVQRRDSTDLKPMMGHSLQMLHLAWCLAVSAAATRCRTGSHTIDWGSRRIQSRNMAASSSGLLLAWTQKTKKKMNGVKEIEDIYLNFYQFGSMFIFSLKVKSDRILLFLLTNLI